MSTSTADEKITAAEAALALGLQRRGKRWGPCPCCGAVADNHRRGPIQANGPRWICYTCGEKGDGINLISWVLTGQRASYREAFRWLTDRGVVEPAIQPVPEPVAQRIPRAELVALLKTCTPVPACRDADVLEHCRRKGIDPRRAPGGILPRAGHPVYAHTREWWPSYRSTTWRIVLPMFDHRGLLAGMHVRATDPAATPKARWPIGVDCAGLFFANAEGRALLGGTCGESAPTEILIVEGFSDFFFAASLAAPPGRALLGIESGSAERLRLVRLPPRVPVYCATHADKAGDAYATKIAEAVGPERTYRLPLMRA